MIVCPFCDAENIPGADHCVACGQSLSELHLPEPATEVEHALLKDRVRVLAPKTPVCVAPRTPVRDVIRTLIDKQIGSVLVVENDRVVGIFSERDALMKLNTEAVTLGDHPVSEFMTASVRTLVESAKIAFAVKEMDLGGYRHLPVVDADGKPTGIISVRDILRYLEEKQAMVG
ncbi:MAG: CBS domain-containing protein [Planctomycetales bacterium]|nr:CBS domain-containing protein [Planctomycetales bacterium]MCA9220975.1 CBS domain-containing protein [Planctomycetales bacterium]